MQAIQEQEAISESTASRKVEKKNKKHKKSGREGTVKGFIISEFRRR